MEHKELIVKYYKGLVNSIFKLIPLFNGEKFRSREIIYSREDAYRNYQIYLSNLLVEVYGNSQFLCSDNSIKLTNILRGMIQEIEIYDYDRVKRLTRQCIDLCKKIIKEIENGEGG